MVDESSDVSGCKIRKEPPRRNISTLYHVTRVYRPLIAWPEMRVKVHRIELHFMVHLTLGWLVRLVHLMSVNGKKNKLGIEVCFDRRRQPIIAWLSLVLFVYLPLALNLTALWHRCWKSASLQHNSIFTFITQLHLFSLQLKLTRAVYCTANKLDLKLGPLCLMLNCHSSSSPCGCWVRLEVSSSIWRHQRFRYPPQPLVLPRPPTARPTDLVPKHETFIRS